VSKFLCVIIIIIIIIIGHMVEACKNSLTSRNAVCWRHTCMCLRNLVLDGATYGRHLANMIEQLMLGSSRAVTTVAVEYFDMGLYILEHWKLQ